MITEAHAQGQQAALRRFKLAGPMGADIGVAPRGDEQSHGTELQPNAPRTPGDLVNSQAPSMPDWLWQLAEYDRLAPGCTDGTFGQETIG